MKNAIVGLHHVALPSHPTQWKSLTAYWEQMGMDVWKVDVDDPDYDEHGAGPRLQVGKGTCLMISYFIGSGPGHVAFKLAPNAIDTARASDMMTGETHWGHSVTSVFLDAPDTSPVHPGIELVTSDPGYHRD